VLWFQPTVESVSDLTRAELTADFQTRIARNPTFSSLSAADLYLRQVVDDERALVAVTTTTATTSPRTSPSTPSSSTTVLGPTTSAP
jgi:hypothetical protein